MNDDKLVRIWKESTHYPVNRLEKLRETTRYLSPDSGCRDRGPNRVHSEYGPRALPLRQPARWRDWRKISQDGGAPVEVPTQHFPNHGCANPPGPVATTGSCPAKRNVTETSWAVRKRT